MAQDSIQNVIFNAHNCECCKSSQQVVTETSYSTNVHDVQTTKLICTSVGGIVVLIVVSLLVATFLEKWWSHKESKLKRLYEEKKVKLQETEGKLEDMERKLKETKEEKDKLQKEFDSKKNEQIKTEVSDLIKRIEVIEKKINNSVSNTEN